MNTLHKIVLNEIQNIHNNLITLSEEEQKQEVLNNIKKSLSNIQSTIPNLNNNDTSTSIEIIVQKLNSLEETHSNIQHLVDSIHKEINKLEELMISLIDSKEVDKPIWERLKHSQLDVLKEIGNIGAGHSATALSKLLGKPIDMKVPKVNILSFNEIADAVGGDENVVVTVFLNLQGDLTGNMFFILQEENAKRFTKSLLGDNCEKEGFSELELSAIQEVGNILSGSYLNALATLTNLTLHPSVPMIAIDMATAVLGYGLIEVGQIGDYALIIDTTFIDVEDNRNINGHFFLLPDPDAFERLFHSLGVPFNE